MSNKVQVVHLERQAAVYLRQSTLKQVCEHRESTARQYALQQRAVDLGWAAEKVVVIDEDLGQSGSSAEWREGFQRMANDVAHGRVGAIFALEVSRLARSSADWHRLLELCGLADVLIIDEQACYTPQDYNDRLLLGLKGTMSEAEQHWMKLRLQGGKLSKARRGELFMAPPPGYQWDEAAGRVRLDPDEEVQRAVRLIFERFRLDGSARAVQRYFVRHGLAMPVRDAGTGQMRPMPATKYNPVVPILRSPVYAGAYVYGRTEQRAALVEGKLERRRTHRISHDAWKICLRDHHPAYIGWDQYLANQERLGANRTNHKLKDQRGAAREGGALLQGLAMCGKCGSRMSVHYQGRHNQAQYQCQQLDPRTAKIRLCFNVSATSVDDAVAKLFLDAVKPADVELSIAVLAEVERQTTQIERQWELRLERLRYEAHLCERRYKAVDPDNRVIVRALEREWNEKLGDVERAEHDRGETLQREKLKLNQHDRAKILSLAKNLPQVFYAETTTHAERKNLVRMLVREVALSPVDVPDRLTRIKVLWQTGAVSDFTVPRPSKFDWAWRRTSLQVTPVVLELFDAQKTDAEIANELNQRGLRTTQGRPWNEGSVRAFRLSRRLARPPGRTRMLTGQRADGLYSANGVAERFGVSTYVVRRWQRKRLLVPVDRLGAGAGNWYRLDPQTISRLKTLAEKTHRRCSPAPALMNLTNKEAL